MMRLRAQAPLNIPIQYLDIQHGSFEQQTCSPSTCPVMDVAQVALNRIRAGAGHWHELARLLPGLAVAGYDATIVDAETGVERRTQSRWAVSLQVGEHVLPGFGFNSRPVVLVKPSCQSPCRTVDWEV